MVSNKKDTTLVARPAPDPGKKLYLFGPLFFLVAGVLLFSLVLDLSLGAMVFASPDSLIIAGEGVKEEVIFTREELEEMEREQCLYSSINTWPTKKWYVGEGIKLMDLLHQAGLKKEATLLRFTAADGFTVDLTYKELFEDQRYCFPNFKKGAASGEGHVPGSASNAVAVEPIIALYAVEGSSDPEYMSTLYSPQLMLGQRAVTEQTGNLFVKYLHKIEVLTDDLERWDVPRGNPPAGQVPKGSMVALSNDNCDDDKIYYTLDGSTPTINSPMYNWIASRWWSTRAEELGTINHPLGPLVEDTTIKAVTIGPGKLDSEVAVFHYRLEGGEGDKGTTILLTIGEYEIDVDGEIIYLDAVPFIKPGVDRTLVPIRFIAKAFGADIAWNPEARLVIISLDGKEVVLEINSSQVYVNGLARTIECPAELHPPGRTFVPLRFISDILGAKSVDYDGESRQISIIW